MKPYIDLDSIYRARITMRMSDLAVNGEEYEREYERRLLNTWAMEAVKKLPIESVINGHMDAKVKTVSGVVLTIEEYKEINDYISMLERTLAYEQERFSDIRYL